MKKNTKFFEKHIISKLPSIGVVREIFYNDIKEIKRNRIVTIIVVGLTIIPSLYAWFNIEAFWDPYGNTKNLSVAVVNDDKGYQFKDQDLHFGDNLVENLKNNKNLDWNFVSDKDAQKGIKTGKYYAIIKIPKDFTKNLTSITRKDVKKASIEYTTNEKTNAIAEKITDQGAKKIQAKISEILIGTISKSSLAAIGGTSSMIGDINPKLDTMKTSLKNLDKQLVNLEKVTKNAKSSNEDMKKLLSSSNNTLVSIKTSLDNSRRLSSDIQSSLNQANSDINSVGPQVKTSLKSISRLINTSSSLAQSLGSLSSSSSQEAIRQVSKIKSNIDQASSRLSNVIDLMNIFSTGNTNILNAAIARLNNHYSDLNNASQKLSNIIDLISRSNQINSDLTDQVASITSDLNDKTNNIILDYDDLITGPLNKAKSSRSDIQRDLDSIIRSTEGIYPATSNFINNLDSMNKNIDSTLGTSQISIDLLRSQIKDSLEMIDKLENNKDLKTINDVIKTNILDRADFIKKPVEIKEVKLYKMANYGSAMAPFYSVLATWVGALILCTLISTDPGDKYKPLEKYYGRLTLFLILSIIQSLIISIGDLVLLGVTAADPFLFISILMLCSVCFSCLIYTLVSVFKTVGKALSMFLLVIQIGGSGGTFPIQMTPTFFKTINSFIPFTYGINACREAIGGVYPPNLYRDCAGLVVFAIIFIIFGTVSKDIINRKLEPLSHRFESSFLME